MHNTYMYAYVYIYIYTHDIHIEDVCFNVAIRRTRELATTIADCYFNVERRESLRHIADVHLDVEINDQQSLQHIYIYIYIHMHTYAYAYIYIYVCMYVYV